MVWSWDFRSSWFQNSFQDKAVPATKECLLCETSQRLVGHRESDEFPNLTWLEQDWWTWWYGVLAFSSCIAALDNSSISIRYVLFSRLTKSWRVYGSFLLALSVAAISTAHL